MNYNLESNYFQHSDCQSWVSKQEEKTGNMREGFKDAVSGVAPLLLQGCRRSREMTTGIRVVITPPHWAQ